MDGSRFDALTRNFSSRRTVVAGVVGGAVATLVGLTTAGDAGAEPKRCPRGKKKCGKRCIPKGQACCTRNEKRCGTKCIAKAKCCKNADCGPGRLCAKGTCVTGQGTCPAGEDVCQGSPSCGANCFCFQTTTGQTRCGDNGFDFDCNECINDANCAANYPQVPGAFCAQGSGGNCFCGTATFCMAPCGLAVLEP